MLRRKKPKPDNAAGLAFPKRKDGKTRGQEKDMLKMSERLVRQVVRWEVWIRSAGGGYLYDWHLCLGKCDLCGRTFKYGEVGEQHEDPSRAKTRNLPPEQRFNRAGTARAHSECHRNVTENRWFVVFDSVSLRFDGTYSVRTRKDALVFRMGRVRGGV